MGRTALFDNIHESHCTISVNFYFIYNTFSKNKFSFSKLSEFQMNHYYDEVLSKRIDYGGNENNRL